MACKTHIAHIAHIARSPETVGVQRLGAALPGRFAETLDSCPPTGQLDFFFTVVPPQDNWIFFSQLSPHRTTGIVFHSCRLRRQPRHFFSWEESRPWRGLGRASMPGRWRGRYAGQVARQETLAFSLEGVSQMVYILPERLLALVRPAFDLVLRRIRSLKRCVQA